MMNSYQREIFNLGKNDKFNPKNINIEKTENIPKIISVNLTLEVRKKEFKLELDDTIIIE